MAQATAQEVLMLALINRARLDPAGEAARYGIVLNEGLPAGTITTGSKQPLALSDALNSSADAHSQAMIDADFFAHTNPNTGSTPQSRGTAAGYSGGVGENIAWSGSTGSINPTQMILLQEQDLFVDEGIAGRGHRTNILAANYQEIGIGQAIGLFLSGGTNYNSSIVTQDLGVPSGSKQFLTGIAYNDTDGNSFYSVGEARAGVNVTSSSSGATTTNAGGDYARSVAAGAQTVTFSGGSLPQSVSVIASVGSATNALINLVGTSTIETSVSLTASSGVTKIIGLSNLGLTLTGSSANDYFVSAPGNDTINGGDGIDSVQFLGNRASYSLTDLGNGSVRVVGLSGTDVLNKVETLVFADQSINWAQKSPTFDQPNVALQSFGFAANGGGWTSQNQFPRMLADVNGDGNADIVGFGNGGVHVSLATGGGNFAAQKVTLAAFNLANGWTSDEAFHRELADVNGDGRADIVGFGNGGVHVSLATNAGNFAAPTVTFAAFNPTNGWTSQDQFSRQLADINGDGKADIVGFGNGGVHVSLATSAGNFAAPTVVLAAFNPANGWTGQDQFSRQLADVNGDGKADIVAFGNAGVLVSLATGGGNFAAPTVELAAFNPANGWTSQNQFPRYLADVNGDGMADIVGFGNGGVYVAKATGGGHFEAFETDIAAFNPSNGWTNDDQFHRELADVNHDGAADIIGFGNVGVIVALAHNLLA